MQNCSTPPKTEDSPASTEAYPAALTQESIEALYSDCTLCPRHCHVNRLQGQKGFCGKTATPEAARSALHFWEEPVLSGSNGSGAVFFSGCNLKCIYCQNYEISGSVDSFGLPLSTAELADCFLRLQEEKAHNINLVTATHFAPSVALALTAAKSRGLSIPVIYNCSGYESVSTLRLFEGLVDIYLPDFKYLSSEVSGALSNAPDYSAAAKEALSEMVRQVPEACFDGDGMMNKGVIVRHLVLPEHIGETKRVLRYLYKTYGDRIYISIMNQYTPLREFPSHPELNRRVTEEEYKRVLDFAECIGIEKGFRQEQGVALESFIPGFHGEGLT